HARPIRAHPSAETALDYARSRAGRKGTMTQQAASSRERTRPAPPRFSLEIRHEPDRVRDLARDVFQGLGAAAKVLQPKHFYDAYGSQLFERICETPEYYSSCTDQALLQRHGWSIVERT